MIANPVFLWLLPVAGLPVLFHLFFRVRKRTRVFPSLMFFRRADPRLSARKKLREWLALILRVLALVFLLLGKGGGGDVAEVLVIDNSGSMSGQAPDGRAKLDHARDAAGLLVSDLRPGDTAALVLLAQDPAAALPPGLTHDRESLRAALDQVRPTEAAGAPSRALAAAAALLESSPAMRREIHVFTDLQAHEWLRTSPAPLSAGPGSVITVHRIQSRPLRAANVAFTAVRVPGRHLLAGRPAQGTATLMNTTSFEANVRVHYVDDTEATGTQSVRVPAHASRTLSLPLQTEAPGFHWLSAWVEEDAFCGDNRAVAGFSCGDRQPVLLAGMPAEFGFLPQALAPADGHLSGLLPRAVPAAEIVASLAVRAPIMAVTSWRTVRDQSGASAALRSYVEQGGILLVVPSTAGSVSPDRVPEWVGARPGPVSVNEKGAAVLVFEKETELWAEARDARGQVLLRGIRAFRFHALTPEPGSLALLGLEDGRALLTSHPRGKGVVFACGLAFDTAWSTLPLKGGFLAMVQGMALTRPAPAEQIIAGRAGENVSPPAVRGSSVRMHALTGGPLDWQGKGDNLPAPARAGVYSLETGSRTRYLVVHADHREGQHEFLAQANVPALAGLSYRVNDYEGGDSFLATVRRARSGLDPFLPLLLLALLAVLAEGWVVNPLPLSAARRTRRAEKKQTGMQTAAVMFPQAMLTWRPHLPPLVCGLLIILLAGWMLVLFRRMRTRMSPRRSMILSLPKAAILVLLVLAVVDPVRRSVHETAAARPIMVMLDTSASMDVKDDGAASRLDRARQASERLRRRLPRRVTVEAMEFDTELRAAETVRPPGRRGTDLAACLLSLSERSDLSSFGAVALFTDGGDETLDSVALPPVPLHVLAFGTDPQTWDDVSVSDVEVPDTVEEGVNFFVRADLRARAASGSGFSRGLATVPVRLAEERDGRWTSVASNVVDLSRGRVRVEFRTTPDGTGLHRYRVEIEEVAGELSTLNNRRTLPVEVRRKSVHVLYYSRELGSELKMLRSELSSDPGIEFTALFRTIGERFTVQGRRRPGDEELDAGFPASASILRLFDCVIIGSFPFDTWREEHTRALLAYAEEGGAVVFMGGEHTFDSGGPAARALAVLLPWQEAGTQAGLLRGEFAVSIPPAAAYHPIVAGLDEALSVGRNAPVSSYVPTGRIKPGAVSLLRVRVAGRAVPLVALHRYGKGSVMAVASNTMWRWSRLSSALKEAYGLFWRQAVRELSGQEEGGRLLGVRWDRPFYRPGERGTAEISLAGERGRQDLQLSASLMLDGETLRLPVEPVQGRPDAMVVKALFRKRGLHRFTLVARRDQDTLETYEKTLAIAPLLDEGAALETDHGFLVSLTQPGGGLTVPESEQDRLIEHLTERSSRQTMVLESSWIYGRPWFLLLFVLICVTEWVLRRRMNLF